jgi:hypothetical protein
MGRGVFLLVVLAGAVVASGQDVHTSVSTLLRGKVTLDAESGCRGCTEKPDSWTPKDTFSAGEKVWIRVKLSNRTHHDAVITTMDFQEDYFSLKATDPQGNELRSAGRRCLLTCECFVAQDGSIRRFDELPPDPKRPPCMLTITASRPPWLEIVKPNKSIELFLDVSDAYKIPGPGEFRLDTSRRNLWLVSERDLPADPGLSAARSIKGAKLLGTLQAKQIRIQVAL